MNEEVGLEQFLGLPANASADVVARRCEQVLDWLESDDIPKPLRSWAENQARIVSDIYGGLPPEVTEVEHDEIVGLDSGRSLGFLPFPGTRALGVVAAGLVVGLVAVGGLWWQGVIFSNAADDEAISPLALENGKLPAEDFLDAQSERLQQLKEMAFLDPADTDVLFEIGETYMVGEDWDQAIEWFTKLVVIDPTNVHAFTDIGTANMNRERSADAEAAFIKVLEFEPENVQIHYNLGFFYAFRPDSPDIATAVGHWEQVVRLDPNSELGQVAQVHIDQYSAEGSSTESPD